MKSTEQKAKYRSNGWFALKYADPTTNRRYFRICVPQIGDTVIKVDIPVENSDAAAIVKALRCYEPAYPEGSVPAEFIDQLIQRVPRKIKKLVSQPALEANGFCAGLIRSGSARDKFLSPSIGSTLRERIVGAKKGERTQWESEVLAPLKHSSYGTLAVLVPLASPLPAYLSVKSSEPPLVSETATFNFSGASGVGKTLCTKIAASVQGSPDNLGSWDFTRRGLEELLASRSYVGCFLDDIEKHTGIHMSIEKAVKTVTQLVCSGHSRRISEFASCNGLPPLTWSTFALSSGPTTISEMASRGAWHRTSGEEVRFIDITVPDLESGGIFDNPPLTSRNFVAFARKSASKIEGGMSCSYGHLMHAWMNLLYEIDCTATLHKLASNFIEKNAGAGNSYDRRFASKFALLYAAGVLARQHGLAPWPKGWVFKAVTKMYRNARDSVSEIDSDSAIRSIGKRISQATLDRPPSRQAVDLDGFLAIRHEIRGMDAIAIPYSTFKQLAGSRACARNALVRLDQLGIIIGKQGHAHTMQLSIPLKTNKTIVSKPRFVVLDRARLRETVKNKP